MAFAHTDKWGETRFLHEKTVTLQGSTSQEKIYFFSLTQEAGLLDVIPSGWKVVELSDSGMPVLKRQESGEDEEKATAV